MSTSKSLPRTLDAWLQQLGKLPLPIEQQQHLRLRRILADSRKTWREIAEAIELSPSFALQVLREANQSGSSLSDPAESVETALSRLGLSRCEALLNQAPALPESEIPLAFRQILLISQHASQQARGLFGARLARLWNELHGCSLLFLAPIWPLLCAHPSFSKHGSIAFCSRGATGESREGSARRLPDPALRQTGRALATAGVDRARLPPAGA